MAKIVFADNTRIDGTAEAFLRQIPTDIPILLVSRQEELIFNEEILELKGKPYILADFIENSWNWDMRDTLILGRNTADFPNVCGGDGWDRLDEFIVNNKP